MIVALEPEQISEHWELIKVGLGRALPAYAKHNEGVLTELLEALLVGAMKCWSIWERGNGMNKVLGFFLTSVIEDIGTKQRNLLIYSLFSFRLVPEPIWQESLMQLKEYAKGLGCTNVVAYSNVPRMIEIAKGLGADVSNVLITMEV